MEAKIAEPAQRLKNGKRQSLHMFALCPKLVRRVT